MGIDTDRLLVLVAVADAGSVSAAARGMSLTPSAVSQQLGKLERELGIRLVERGPRGVTLTEAGRAVVGHGEVVLGELRAAEQAVRALLGRAPDRLAIGTFATAGASLVPRVLATFRRDHPSVRLSLRDIEPPDGYGLVTSRDLDLLITHRYPGVALPEAPGLRRELLLRDPLLLVLPTDHPKAADHALRLADLAGEDWISGAHGIANRVALESITGPAGFAPHVAYETQDYQVTLALVEAGLGIALVPATVVRQRRGYRCVDREPPDVAPAREVHLVHGARPLPLVAEMLALVRAAAARIARRQQAGTA